MENNSLETMNYCNKLDSIKIINKGIPSMNKIIVLILLAVFFAFPLYAETDEDFYAAVIETFEVFYSISYDDYDQLEEQDAINTDVLLDFLSTEKSLSIDITENIRTLDYLTSPDERIKIYKWDTRLYSHTSILQYMTSSGQARAVLLNDNPISIPSVDYSTVLMLKKNVYLLSGNERGDSHTQITAIAAVELRDDELIPYNAFNNETSLIFTGGVLPPWAESNGRICDYEFLSEEGTYIIRIFYWEAFEKIEKRKEYNYEETLPLKQIDFIFNGEKFIGDYEKLYLLADY